MIYSLDDIKNISLKIDSWCKIFLYWDLWAGKTTLIKNLLKNIFGIQDNIVSPTYIHYKKYNWYIYHFDLYRLENYDDFVNIWWEEILDNKENICLIEWPEILDWFFEAEIKILISKTNDDSTRNIEIIDLR